MTPFIQVSGPAAALAGANIDTDVIMPKQYLKGIDRAGLRAGALHDLRFTGDDRPRDDFVLNKPAWKDAVFLVVGPNFGCGSSREHAVWGLLQLGIRAIFGSSFAGIFEDNAANNGLLLLGLKERDLELLGELAKDPARNRFVVDLPTQTIAAGGRVIDFSIDSRRKDLLVRGLDPIGLTLEDADAIQAFEIAHHAASPWLA